MSSLSILGLEARPGQTFMDSRDSLSSLSIKVSRSLLNPIDEGLGVVVRVGARLESRLDGRIGARNGQSWTTTVTAVLERSSEQVIVTDSGRSSTP